MGRLAVVTVVGLLGALVLMALTLSRPRSVPVHRVPWIIGLVAIIVSLVFRLTIIIGAAVNGALVDVMPILIGEIAVALVLVAAVRQPAWAGWFLAGTAITLPALTWALSFIDGWGELGDIAPPMLGFYGLPALITAVLLIVSERPSALQPAPAATEGVSQGS